MIDCVLCLFLVVPWVGLQCVIVVYHDHTNFLILINLNDSLYYISVTNHDVIASQRSIGSECKYIQFPAEARL